MQQQDEGPCEVQENSLPEIQEHTSDEVAPEATASDVQEENDDKDTVLEIPATTIADELDVENTENDHSDVSSDSPSTRSKTSRQSSKKRLAKQEKEDTESVEKTQSELRHDNGLSENLITEDLSVVSNTVNDVDDVHDVIVHEPDEANTLEISNESGHLEYTEFPAEDETSENSQEVVEEISISASLSYEELSQPKGKHSDVSEKCSLSISSSELHQFTSNFSSKEENEEHTFNSKNLTVSGSSWGGSIRSVSARRPVRKFSHFMMQERSSVSSDRARTDENHSDTDCSVDTTEGSIFSLKRKACVVDTTNSKKQKITDSKNTNFFSMVSSPLRMLKNKIGDRRVQSVSTPRAEDIANGEDNNDDTESINDTIKKENKEIKEMSLCVVGNEVNNQNSLYRSWCSIM